MGVLEKVLENLSGTEALFILKLLPCIPYDGHYLKNKNNKPLTYEQMLEKSGMSERNFQRILANLKGKNVVRKRKNEEGKTFFYFNPYFSKKGVRIDIETEKLFNNNERKADNQG